MYDWAEFRHFRYLLAILEKQGFRAAAEELHTAQPNLSVQAKQFQENASVRLYRKTKSGRIRVTDTGVAFMTLARFLLETRQEVIDTLIALERGELTSLRFGCSSLADSLLFRDLCQTQKEIVPACQIRPSHGDTAQLAREVYEGSLDAALITLPLTHPDLKIDLLRKDRLVCCMRRDHPLAASAVLKPSELQDNLGILFHPERHPDAHARLLELLSDVGVRIQEYARASHPIELQSLVKDGHGFALIREGSSLDDALTTRPIAGVDWTLDVAVIYHKERHPKSVPLLIKRLKRSIAKLPALQAGNQPLNPQAIPSVLRRPPQSHAASTTQLNLLGEYADDRDKCA